MSAAGDAGSLLLLGDVFGLVALALIGATAILMLMRRRLLRYFRNLELLRRLHIIVSAAAGLFLVLHVAYFITYPASIEIALGYLSAIIALVVWLTGTAFLERFRDSLFFHSTLSLSGISLMVIHSAAAGANIPFTFAALVLGSTTTIAFLKTTQYIQKLRRA